MPTALSARLVPGPWLRVHLTYLWRHRRLLSLGAPTRLTELIQRRKLFDHDARFPALIDKLVVKSFVVERLGADWVTPTLWSGTELPPAQPWTPPFVVKARHGCNQSRFVRSGDDDWRRVRAASARWSRSRYGGWLDEWGYRDVLPGLLVEPFLGEGTTLPVDYKLFVFNGRVRYIQVHLDRDRDHRWLVYDLDWNRVSPATADPDPPRPVSLADMVEGAERLAPDFDFVRVDFYEIDGRPRFGEMTFYPGSGLDPVVPPELDVAMGTWWTMPTRRTLLPDRRQRSGGRSETGDTSRRNA